MARLTHLLALIGAIASAASSVSASVVYGIQATTGSILTIDPNTSFVRACAYLGSPLRPCK